MVVEVVLKDNKKQTIKIIDYQKSSLIKQIKIILRDLYNQIYFKI